MMGMRARLARFGHQPGSEFAGRDLAELAELDKRVMEIVQADRKLAQDRFDALVELLVGGFNQLARAMAGRGV